MGSWSYGPIDNDTAADWLGDTMDKSKLPKRIENGLKSRKYPNKVRAAAFLLEKVGYVYMYDVRLLDKHLKLAVERLGEILDDGDWIATWSRSGEIKKSLRKQISTLTKRIDNASEPGSQGLIDAINAPRSPVPKKA